MRRSKHNAKTLDMTGLLSLPPEERRQLFVVKRARRGVSYWKLAVLAATVAVIFLFL